MTEIARICLIGFGEVGRILAADLSGRAALSLWDTQFGQDAQLRNAAAQTEARIGADAADAARGAELVISAVTPAQTVAAARAAAGGLQRGAWYFDVNSASPGAKRDAAGAVADADGLYVEAAVMSPVPPKRLCVPMLLGGPHAQAFLPPAHELGFAGARFFSSELGRAAAAKMCRSVIVKGLEALLGEALVTARGHGVDADVIASLDDLLPGPDWPRLARYMIARSIEHGARRAEEMGEAARTVGEAGLAAPMSEAAAERMIWAAQFAEALRHDEIGPMLDAMGARAGSARP